MDTATRPLRRLLRRFGVAGILFFLAKGLLWLTVPLFLAFEGCTP